MRSLAALLVLAPQGIRIQYARHGAEADERHADDIPLLVKRCIIREERISRDDSSNVAEA